MASENIQNNRGDASKESKLDNFYQLIKSNDVPKYLFGGFWKRTFAYLIDFALSMLISTILLNLTYHRIVASPNQIFILVVNLLVFLLYFYLSTLLMDGQTPGKILFGLKVLHDSKIKLNNITVVIREIAGRIIYYFLPILAVFLIFSDKRKSLVDYFSDTVVIDESKVLRYMELSKDIPYSSKEVNTVNDDTKSTVVAKGENATSPKLGNFSKQEKKVVEDTQTGKKLKLALVQPDLLYKDPAHNFEEIQNFVTQAAQDDVDVIVLPEMWNTSFFPEELEVDADGSRAREHLKNMAEYFNVNIVGGSIARLDNDQLKNTAYIYDREGREISSYDKVHLFSPSGESDVYTPGNSMSTFEIDGVKCGIIICYDLRFVEWVRKYALEGTQVLFVVAAWPEQRIDHWEILNKARAIENQFYVVHVNSTGEVPSGILGGKSGVIGPFGEVIAQAGSTPTTVYAEIDLDVVTEIRQKMNIYDDRQVEYY